MGNTNSNIDQRIDLHLTVRELQAEIKSLKEDNDLLRNELKSHLAMKTTKAVDDVKQRSVVSSEVVNVFVEQLLSDPTVNVGFVPDMIERPLERKMMLAILGAIGHLLDSASVEVMGHEILLCLQPKVAADASDINKLNLVKEPEPFVDLN